MTTLAYSSDLKVTQFAGLPISPSYALKTVLLSAHLYAVRT